MKVQYIKRKILLQLKEKNPESYNHCKIQFPEIDKWISGEDYPTYNQILELSKLFNVPFDYFLDDLPKGNTKHKVIYLSGSITNDPDYIDKFNYWERMLEYKFPKAEIKNPIDFVYLTNGTKEEIWANAMITCLIILKDCTDIFIIPENKESIGRDIEIMFADYLGLNFITIDEID
jgi:transcriptional regulator with XRE-family HTH domain